MEQNEEDFAFLAKLYDATLIDRLTAIVNSTFARVTYTEASSCSSNQAKNFNTLLNGA